MRVRRVKSYVNYKNLSSVTKSRVASTKGMSHIGFTPLAIAIIGIGVSFGQTAEKATFETASVRPSDPAKPESFWSVSPGRLSVRNMSLKSLVMAFYKVKQYQVTGGPKWVDTDRFDIQAKLADQPAGSSPRSSEAVARLMSAAQALLADRFQLVLYNETKQVSGYALVVAKTGPKLKAAEGDGSSNVKTGRGTLRATGLSMERFASSLSTILDAPVVDATDLKSAYDFTLEWTPDMAADSNDAPTQPSLYAALQEKLGLKLESRKVPVPVFTIERAEKPAEN
jgi:uncharacterized protein (TIGR03435 family)